MHKLYIHIKFFSEEVTGPTFKPFNIKELKNPNPDWHDFCFMHSNKNRRRFNQGGGYEIVKKFGFSRWSFYIFDLDFRDPF